MRKMAIVGLLFVLAACSTSRNVLQRKTEELQALLAAGRYETAVALARLDFNYDNADSAAFRKELAKYPGASAAVFARLKSEIDFANDAKTLEELPKAINLAQRDSVISSTQATALRASFVQRVESSLRSGPIQYDLANSEIFEAIPELNSPESQWLLFERSLKEIPSAFGARRDQLLDRSFKLAKSSGTDSAYDRALRANLGAFNLTTPELKRVLLPYDAVRGQQFLEARVRRVVVRSEPSDRLLEEDMKELISRKDDDISFADSPSPEALIVTVGKLQYEERTDPERKETITYQQYEVNLLGAVLLMPRNASYMYEHVTGGFDVSAAFLIKIARGSSVIVDKVVRERVSKHYNHCENARIVNVFGGVQKAEFVANDDMTRRCNNASSRQDPATIRAEILSKVADDIVGQIRK